jgi:hypothetical protein
VAAAAVFSSRGTCFNATCVMVLVVLLVGDGAGSFHSFQWG